MEWHSYDAGGDTRDIEEWIWDGGEHQDCPTSVFLYPGSDPVIDIRPLDDGLPAKSREIPRKLADCAACPGSQANAERVEDGSHCINDGDPRRGKQDGRIGKQRDQKDARVAKRRELLYAVTNAVNEDCDRDYD